jgi:hypothetical protein
MIVIIFLMVAIIRMQFRFEKRLRVLEDIIKPESREGL